MADEPNALLPTEEDDWGAGRVDCDGNDLAPAFGPNSVERIIRVAMQTERLNPNCDRFAVAKDAAKKITAMRALAPKVDEGVRTSHATFLTEWANDIDRNAGGHSVDAARLRAIAALVSKDGGK